MKRTIFRTTAAAMAVFTPMAAAAVVGPAAIAEPAPAVAPAEVQLNTKTPGQDPAKTQWRTIVADYQNAGYEVEEVSTFSPSMNRAIPVVLIRPLDKAKRDNAPTVYLLNGADGGEGRANWMVQTDIIEFWGGNEGKRLEQKKSRNNPNGPLTSPGIGANIVIPMAGAFSYYSDWTGQNPGLQGTNREGQPSGQKQNWETYITQELPEGLEPAIGANGTRAVAGMSMTGTTSLLYAQHHPGKYSAIGSFSGCAETTSPMGTAFAEVTLNRGGANMGQMWGGNNTDTARYNDALLNADKLKGQPNIYVSNGTGIAGRHDMLDSPRINGNVLASAQIMVEGGVIEAGTNACTHNLANRTNQLDIPVKYNFRPQGTHQWGYWQDDTRDFWPTLVKGLGTGAVQPNAKQDPYHAANGGSGSSADLPNFFPLQG